MSGIAVLEAAGLNTAVDHMLNVSALTPVGIGIL